VIVIRVVTRVIYNIIYMQVIMPMLIYPFRSLSLCVTPVNPSYTRTVLCETDYK